LYGQDAEYVKARSYTDLGNGIVRDNVTGLEWVQDGNVMATRNSSFDKDSTAGDGRVTWQHALDYVALLNAEEYLGHEDWRLPTVRELSSLVDSSRYNPSIDPVFSTMASGYWSSTTNAYITIYAWYVGFNDGVVYYNYKTNYSYVRAVRGNPLPANNFIDNNDGTITDTATGLMWQQAPAPGTYAWQQALAYCENLDLAGHTDWRLPDRNELQSIVDYSRHTPSIDPVFSEMASGYWSSATGANYTNYACGVASTTATSATTAISRTTFTSARCVPDSMCYWVIWVICALKIIIAKKAIHAWMAHVKL